MKTTSIVVVVLAGLFASACGPDAAPTCDQCLSQQSQAIDPDGCWPYCGGGDADSDGVDDATDACPEDPETVNGYVDADGCPEVGVDRFGGTWAGFTGFIVGSNPAVNYWREIRISPSNGGARIEWLCSIGTDAIQTVYSGGELHWEGLLECPVSTIDGCMTTVRLTDARAFMTQSGAILIEAHGTSSTVRSGSGCASGPASLYYSFHATR